MPAGHHAHGVRESRGGFLQGYPGVNIPKDVESPFFPGKCSTNGGFSTSM